MQHDPPKPDFDIKDPDYPDPIVEEIRAIRHKLAAECNNDVSKIFEDLRRKQETSGREYVRLPPRPVSNTLIPPLDTTTDNATNQPAE